MAPNAPSKREMSPAELLIGLNQGLNLYTDPTQCTPKQWYGALNVYSGAFGYIQRARFANVVTHALVPTYVNGGTPFTTFKFFALPGLSNYLLADNDDGNLWSFDTGSAYAAVRRFNPYYDAGGFSNPKLNGPWMREVLSNIVYEMNGTVKQAGRGANAAIIENFGIDAPDASPAVVVNAGNLVTLTSIQRTSGTVTAILTGAPTADMAVGRMVNATGVSDTSFNGTFVVLTNDGVNTLTWAQAGQDSTLIAGSGDVDTDITKSIGRSYSYAWENANKFHVSAPSPSTIYFLYTAQNGTIDAIETGTVTIAAGNSIVTGIGTAFTDAWVGRSLWVNTVGSVGLIASVQSTTQLTLLSNPSTATNQVFQVYDPASTNIRLYQTADGGAVYFRTQRNAFVPSATTLVAAGLRFYDQANAEPPGFPYTTEISQLYNVPPPIGQFIKEYQGSLIVYGVPGALQTFFYSNTSLTTIGLQQESFAPLNQVTLPIQNASINGMVEFPGALIIWSDKQDMFRLTGLLTDNTSATAQQQGSSIAALPYNLGCASPFAVALTPLGAIWLSSNGEVWLFTDSYAPRNIGRSIQQILQTINPAYISNSRMTYYHSYNRNWVALSVPANGATVPNTVLMLDLDLLASNGSPSFFTFDMATNQPSWYQFSAASGAMEVVYETGGNVRLLVGGVDVVEDIDYRQGFGTEIAVTGGTVTTHAWGNDSPMSIKRPSWFRFNTNRDPSQLVTDGWSFGVNGIDDDYYTFPTPLTLVLTPGVNDTITNGGNPLAVPYGTPFRTSYELFKVGGVNYVAGRRLQFTCNFPSAPGVDYQLRSIQLGFGVSPPR